MGRVMGDGPHPSGDLWGPLLQGGALQSSRAGRSPKATNTPQDTGIQCYKLRTVCSLVYMPSH